VRSAAIPAADDAHGTMAETEDGGGHFTEVVLRPRVTVADETMIDRTVSGLAGGVRRLAPGHPGTPR